MIDQIQRDIEAILEARTGRQCMFMPSGRFAIHLAFQLLLSPGDRILMSPLEDDTVFFGALAAGLRPVMAPVSTHDGNMRIDVIDDANMVNHFRGSDRQHLWSSRPCRRTQRDVQPIQDSAHRRCRPCTRNGP